MPQASADWVDSVHLSELNPGGSATTNVPVKNKYEENAYALSQGEKFYNNFNCVGCHSHGGGGMGPALMDDEWIYGSNPEQIFATIIQGRPNGMPAFGGKIPEFQVWQLAAYVRSLSGLASKGAAPGRSDHISGKKPENSVKEQQPKASSLPKSAEMPK
jgi:cytochrome c oxidase cbb3-type subunit 3